MRPSPPEKEHTARGSDNRTDDGETTAWCDRRVCRGKGANRVGDCGSLHFRYRFVSSFQAMGRKPIQILPRLSGASREEGRTFSPLPATPKMIPATATPALQNARTRKRARSRISRRNPRKKR